MIRRGNNRERETQLHPEVPVFAPYLSEAFLKEQEHDIYKQIELQKTFYADRPVLLLHNNNVENSVHLLVEEIMELNGHSEDGMSLEDYRAQECVDIWNYALAVMIANNHIPNTHAIDEIIQSIGIEKVKQSSEIPSRQYPEKYEVIKRGMVATAHDFFTHDDTRRLRSREEVIRTAERLWAYTSAALSVLGRNPLEEFRDKLARNMLKYPSDALAHDLSEGAYQRYTKKHKVRWKAEGERPNGGNPYFFERQRPRIPEVITTEPLTLIRALGALGLTPRTLEAVSVETDEMWRYMEAGLPVDESSFPFSVWAPLKAKRMKEKAVSLPKQVISQARAYLR